MNCIEVADAVVAEINSEYNGFGVQAARTVMPVYDLATESGLKISVVPKSVDIGRQDRGSAKLSFQVDVGIQQKINDDIENEVEALLETVHDIEKYLRKRELSTLPDAVWLSTVNDPLYSQEHLKSDRMFTSILTLTYITKD